MNPLVAETRLRQRDLFAEVATMLEKDFAKARLMERNEYDQNPPWFKFAVRSARLAAPIL